MDASGWNDRYRTSTVWSGQPNEAIVAHAPEPHASAAGRPWALDLGCGEGADAIWLATHGWHVIGVDWSSIALERARAAADDAGVDATFVEGDISDASGIPSAVASAASAAGASAGSAAGSGGSAPSGSSAAAGSSAASGGSAPSGSSAAAASGSAAATAGSVASSGSTTAPATGQFDLVTVAFLHPEPDQRARTYGSLASLIAPGGHLLVVAHDPEHGQLGLPGPQPHRLLSAQDVLTALDLPADFEVLVRMAEPRRLDSEVVAVDSVVLARRLDAPL